jgi:predicted dehydrogenase
MLNIGLIGYQNHAARLLELVNQSTLAKVRHVYHPIKELALPGATRELVDLFACDAIFIASPNDTHFGYLQYLSENYSGYIFCEKPPLSSLQELDEYSGNSKRVFFNFNYRFSRIRDAVTESIENGELGQPIHMFVSMSQGLAYKDSYPGSWRADATRHRHGVTETKSIHFIDMAIFLFGDLSDYNYTPSNIAKTGSAYDTSFINLHFRSGPIVTLLMSYATPLTSEMRVVGTNGVIEYKDDVLKIYSPRDTFDERGFFASPPEKIIFGYANTAKDLYEESLERSVDYFMQICADGMDFPANLHQASLDTNRLVLELTENISNKEDKS